TPGIVKQFTSRATGCLPAWCKHAPGGAKTPARPLGDTLTTWCPLPVSPLAGENHPGRAHILHGRSTREALARAPRQRAASVPIGVSDGDPPALAERSSGDPQDRSRLPALVLAEHHQLQDPARQILGDSPRGQLADPEVLLDMAAQHAVQI